jgi:anti-sigma factor RsiW
MVRLIKRRAIMRCSKAVKKLSPYLDGELGARDNALLEAHLTQCDRCAYELKRLLQLHGLICQAQRFSAPPDFHSKVMERVIGRQTKGFSLFPVFTRFAEAIVFVLAITAGIMSGGMLISSFSPQHKGAQLISSLSLDTFEALPPDSLGRAYLAMTEESR